MAQKPAPKKKLPPMYYTGDADKKGLRSADFMSEDSADPMDTIGYQGEESHEPEPARGVKGYGPGPRVVDKLRKKGPAYGKQSGESGTRQKPKPGVK